MKKISIVLCILLTCGTASAENWQKIASVKGQEFYYLSDAVRRIDADKIETKFKRQDKQGEVISAVKINCSTRSMLTTQVVVNDYTTGKTHVLNSDNQGQAATTYYKIPKGTVQDAAVTKVCR